MGNDENRADREFWEDRYAAKSLSWSGNPNPVLVTEATGLTPGRALDIGCGEGADALWLAQQGWQVTGVDIATNALDKARAHAECVDPAAAARIDWQQHDVTMWAPEPRSFDLVSVQFMHLSKPIIATLFRSLAAAVAPRGTLLIVGHDASDTDEGSHNRAHLAELMYSADDVLDVIKDEMLRIEIAEPRSRHVTSAEGVEIVHDVVVKVSRTAA
ncbi:class I SAM-dependent methyltransferase [Salinibacterium sp. TMP30]|uniref:class I SAM-dependent methyltransferase n=1 Tax=Salinibacterium sp. TMP30 TaxID=3138237 RepID=UPI003139D543